jgi:hypothetical protein
LALLKIEDRVRWISLRKEGFLRRQLDDFSSQTGARKESGYIESGLFKFNHRRASFRLRPLQVDRRTGTTTLTSAKQSRDTMFNGSLAAY